MAARSELGSWVLYEAQVSFSYWMANDFEKEVLKSPMFDKNQSLKIIEMHDNMRSNNAKEKNISRRL